MISFSRWIGIPYRPMGYDFSGCFCWGLVWLYHREELGSKLPRRPDPENHGFRRVQKPREGTILQMRGHRAGKITQLHTGVFVAPDRVLHIEEGTGSVIEDINSMRFQWRPIQAWELPIDGQ